MGKMMLKTLNANQDGFIFY